MIHTASDTKAVGRDLTEGPIFSTLVVFALPIILANVIQQLYGMVDLAVVGQFVGSIGTVGVNTGGEMADICVTGDGRHLYTIIRENGNLAVFEIGQDDGTLSEETRIGAVSPGKMVFAE